MFTFNLENSGADRCSMALPVQNELQKLLICSDLLNQLLLVYIDLIYLNIIYLPLSILLLFRSITIIISIDYY